MLLTKILWLILLVSYNYGFAQTAWNWSHPITRTMTLDAGRATIQNMKFKRLPYHYSVISYFFTVESTTKLACANHCMEHPQCITWSYSSSATCSLFDFRLLARPHDVVFAYTDIGNEFFEIEVSSFNHWKGTQGLIRNLNIK